MKIFFVETERTERIFFEGTMEEHDLYFADALSDIPEDADIISNFIHSKIDVAFLDAHPALKLIATRSTTCDHIDLEACTARGVLVSIIESYGDNVVAEHTFALILALSRRLRQAMKLGASAHFSYEALRGFELRGKTLGIVGTGRVGLHTVPMAKGFGMEVIACDIQERPEMAAQLGFEYVSFEELLERAHVISLHAPLTPRTYHLLGREAFARCRRGVYVINTARGRLIDTEALIEALDLGIVAGAGLDVLGEESVLRRQASHVISDQIVRRLRETFERNECRSSDPSRAKQIEKLMHLGGLLERTNVVFTPHIAFNCTEALERINRATVRNIEAFISGVPTNVVAAEIQKTPEPPRESARPPGLAKRSL